MSLEEFLIKVLISREVSFGERVDFLTDLLRKSKEEILITRVNKTIRNRVDKGIFFFFMK